MGGACASGSRTARARRGGGGACFACSPLACVALAALRMLQGVGRAPEAWQIGHDVQIESTERGNGPEVGPRRRGGTGWPRRSRSAPEGAGRRRAAPPRRIRRPSPAPNASWRILWFLGRRGGLQGAARARGAPRRAAGRRPCRSPLRAAIGIRRLRRSAPPARAQIPPRSGHTPPGARRRAHSRGACAEGRARRRGAARALPVSVNEQKLTLLDRRTIIIIDALELAAARRAGTRLQGLGSVGACHL